MTSLATHLSHLFLLYQYAQNRAKRKACDKVFEHGITEDLHLTRACVAAMFQNSLFSVHLSSNCGNRHFPGQVFILVLLDLFMHHHNTM